MKKGLLIKRKDNNEIGISIVEINNNAGTSELNKIYNHLDVDLIDIVNYKNKSIYIDDEGLLKANPQVIMILNDGNQYLYGNILIMGDCDENGETLGLNDKEALSLIKEMRAVKNLESNQELILW